MGGVAARHLSLIAVFNKLVSAASKNEASDLAGYRQRPLEHAQIYTTEYGGWKEQLACFCHLLKYFRDYKSALFGYFKS